MSKSQFFTKALFWLTRIGIYISERFLVLNNQFFNCPFYSKSLTETNNRCQIKNSNTTYHSYHKHSNSLPLSPSILPPPPQATPRFLSIIKELAVQSIYRSIGFSPVFQWPCVPIKVPLNFQSFLEALLILKLTVSAKPP